MPLLDASADDRALAAQQDFGEPRVTAQLNAAAERAALAAAPLLRSAAAAAQHAGAVKRQLLVDRTLFRPVRSLAGSAVARRPRVIAPLLAARRRTGAWK